MRLAIPEGLKMEFKVFILKRIIVFLSLEQAMLNQIADEGNRRLYMRLKLLSVAESSAACSR